MRKLRSASSRTPVSSGDSAAARSAAGPTVHRRREVAPHPSRETTVAAVDLGSNSFHMVLARVGLGHLLIVDRLREMVLLSSGLSESGDLDAPSQRRALQCLRRFGQRVRALPGKSVRVVGTQTLRLLNNNGAFLEKAAAALGHPVEVLKVDEESRLIYRGVAADLAEDGERRIVIDIGGASTELIVGERLSPLKCFSLPLGSGLLSRRHFDGGIIRRKRMQQAKDEVRSAIEPFRREIQGLQWKQVIGSSGTIRAVERVVRLCHSNRAELTSESVRWLEQKVLEAGTIERIRMDGLSSERRPVFPGGVAILTALFEALELRALRVSEGALREGLLYEMTGLHPHKGDDIRDSTIDALAHRHHVDLQHAERVAVTACSCLKQVGWKWGLESETPRRFLRWAALLHEIGLSIAHDQHHRHGAYVLEHSDMPGFAREEQMLLSTLVGAQRKKIDKTLRPDLPPYLRTTALYLAILLRLSVILQRARDHSPLPAFSLEAGRRSLRLRFPRRWLDQHPLTRSDLEQEESHLRRLAFDLKVD